MFHSKRINNQNAITWFSYIVSGGVNHSCEPTIRPINPNFDMLALKDIQRGEELTNDYWGPNQLGCNCPKCSIKR